MKTIRFSRLKKALAVTLGLSPILDTTSAWAAGPIDLRPYFPAADNVYRLSNGYLLARYIFFPSSSTQNPDFWNLYTSLLDLNSAGSLMIWAKGYYTPPPLSTLCPKTYGVLLVGSGSDKSVREAGDWYNDADPVSGVCQNSWGALGYQQWPVGGYASSPAPSFSLSNTTALNWSGPSGLDDSWGSYQSGYVFRQAPDSSYPYAAGAPPWAEYSTPALIETLSTWSPEYGRNAMGLWVQNPGRTYTNVVRIVLYHGTGISGQTASTCTDNSAIGNPYAGWYHHHGPVMINGVSTSNFYSTYAMEFYLSTQYGILQETLLYDESQCGTKAYPALQAAGTNYTNSLLVNRWYIDH
jgi:hypothetical protein